MPLKVLILGGTNDARRIAQERLSLGDDVTTSLAGVTRDPILPEGKLRVGGFGGAVGLREFLVTENIDLLIDATHPYAGNISANARTAVAGTGTKLEVFEREAWQIDPDWIVVADSAEASARIQSGSKVFVTVGRRELAPLLMRNDLSGVIRSIEPPLDKLPQQWQLIQQRPPYDLDDEMELMRAHRFTHLITKNSGGLTTQAKLEAARNLGIQVVVIARR